MARKRKQYPLRISPELFDALEAWAADEFRSVNAQIEAILMDAARRSGRLRPRRRPASSGGTDAPTSTGTPDDQDDITQN